jgi:uncharacterized protein (DUF58 family)
MQRPAAFQLTERAERAALGLPPLLVEAQRIAATVILGVHGRKRAGPGESFWQYRPYSFGDSTQRIDWHKSARADRVFIRENEWEAANSLWLWCSPAAGMAFRSHLAPVTKHERAAVLALALAVLAIDAQERVAAIGAPFAPGHARSQLLRIAAHVTAATGGSLPDLAPLPRFASLVLFGDFLDPIEDIARRLAPLAATGAHGHVVQICDPAEETLPYAGRIEFLAMEGPERFLAGKTEALRAAYVARFQDHRQALRDLARRLGWSFSLHRTDQSATAALMQLHGLIGGAKSRLNAGRRGP